MSMVIVSRPRGALSQAQWTTDDDRNAIVNLAIPIRIDQQIEARLGSVDFARLTELARGL